MYLQNDNSSHNNIFWYKEIKKVKFLSCIEDGLMDISRFNLEDFLVVFFKLFKCSALPLHIYVYHL